MKNILITLPLLFAGCATTPYMVPMDVVVVRSIERVVERHDSYVEVDSALSADQRELALSDSQSLSLMTVMPEVSASMLSLLLEPVMERHDSYVRMDPDLDDIERGVYLESTRRLRSLVSAVEAPVPVQ